MVIFIMGFVVLVYGKFWKEKCSRWQGGHSVRAAD